MLFLNLLRTTLLHLAVASLIFSPIVSYANETLPIKADGATNTQVTKTASGIDQINIAAPNSAGLSHNKFSDYNVNKSGQIINNFSGNNKAEIAAGAGATAVTKTQIGGLVNTNANLAKSGAAKVILNEVTSSNLSKILGYVEIAGSKADLIIANPNGITCSGCGFINTAHLLMVAGSSNFKGSGANLDDLGFNLKEQTNPNLYVPLITIDGLGLDVTRTSAADIIASSVKLLAVINGSADTRLAIRAGEGRYDYVGGAIDGAQGAGGAVGGASSQAGGASAGSSAGAASQAVVDSDNSAPVFAIDASSLAKIQSGQVFLIATKQGVGVKMAAEILGSATVNIDVNGDVYYSSIKAGDAVNLKSVGKVQAVDFGGSGLNSNSNSNSNPAPSIAAANLTIEAAEFKNFGKVSAYNLKIQNSGALSNFGDIEALNLNLTNIDNINNFGSIYGQDSLQISGGNLSNASLASYVGGGVSGNIFSLQDYSVILNGVLNNAGVVSSDKNLTVEANQLVNDGQISAAQKLDFTIADSAVNRGDLIADNDLNFRAKSLTNLGNVQAAGDAVFNLLLLDNAANSSLYSGQNLSLNFGDNSNLNLNKSLTNLGEISALKNLTIAGDALIINNNKILANGSLKLVGSGLTNNLNAVIASLNSSTNLTLAADLKNYGNINSKADTTISAADFNNLGLIKSAAKITIDADKVTNQTNAEIFAENDLVLKIKGDLSNGGIIYSTKNLTIDAKGSLINYGEIFAKDSANLTFSFVKNYNIIIANNNLAIKADSIDNKASGAIASINKSLTLNLSDQLKNAGTIFAQENLILANLENDPSILNDAANDGALDDDFFDKDADKFVLNLLDNSGEISFNKLSGGLRVKNFINLGLINSNQDLKLLSTDSFNNLGEISAKKNLTIILRGLDDLQDLAGGDGAGNGGGEGGDGAGSAGGEAGDGLEIAEGGGSSGAKADEGDGAEGGEADQGEEGGEALDSQNPQNNPQNAKNKNSGKILAAQNLYLTTDSLNNSGEISAQNDLEIKNNPKVGGALVDNDQISPTNQPAIYNSGNIISKGTLSIAANNFANTTNAVLASLAADIKLDIANDLQNDGEINAAQNLIINSKNFINNGDVLSAKKLTILSKNSIENFGNFQAGGDLLIEAEDLFNFAAIKSFGKGKINAATIYNQTNSLVFFADDSEIFANNLLTNFGDILSNGKLKFVANQIANNGEIFSNNDLSFVVADSLNNGGIVSSLANIDISSNLSFTNSNQILSGGNLTINTGNLVNTKSSNLSVNSLIQSNGDLILNLKNLTNSSSIISGAKFNITATENISNLANLQSRDNFVVTAASFSNSALGLILAGKDLSINASSINNKNTKPASSIITSGIVALDGNIALQTDNLNNDFGIIASKATTLNGLNFNPSGAKNVNLSNNLGSFISTATIELNLGALDYTITGTITAANIDITANNITNQGNVTATDFIKLNATGDSGVAGAGNITNGFANGDNSNVALAAGAYIDLVAKNNINNYGSIIATTNLTLSATNGNINNYYNTGKITGGAGTTTINALNGAFNNLAQTSIFTADNDAIFNVKDLNNNGEISVANDLLVNASGDLKNNATALIWSGRDAIFYVANNFVNDRADIYANGDLVIQKNDSEDAALNKTALVQNISGSIETYEGDVTIRALTLENKRSSMKTQKYVYETIYLGYYGHEHQYRSTYTASFSGTAGEDASIYSGGNISLTLGTLNNDSASILAAKNITIDAAIIKNTSYNFEAYKNVYPEWWYQYNPYKWLTTYKPPATIMVNDKIIGYRYYRGNRSLGYYTIDQAAPSSYGRRIPLYSKKEVLNPEYVSESYIASIKSGAALTIAQNGTVNSSFINGNNVSQYSSIGDSSNKIRSTNINKIDTYTLDQTGIINVDLSAIANAIDDVDSINGSELALSTSNTNLNTNSQLLKTGTIVKEPVSNTNSNQQITNQPNEEENTSNPIFSGTFKINLDGPTTTPLVESRSQFTDASKYFGSSYYFDQLGLNGNTVLAEIDRQTRQPTERAIRILGDSFVEQKLIIDQLQALTNDSFLLDKDATTKQGQTKQLLDNAIAELTRLNLNANTIAINGLTTDQIKLLTKDIITFEATTINGIRVLAPKIYLAQSTRDRLLNADMITGAVGLASSATLFGKDSLTINAENSSLKNNGSIVSAGNITITAASLANKTNSIAQAQIVAGRNLAITAIGRVDDNNNHIANSGDIKNIGANIAAVGEVALTATQGSILNSAIVKTNDKALLSSSFGQFETLDPSESSYQLAFDKAARTSGNIQSTLIHNASIKGGSININAAKDFNNLAATISATKNNLDNQETSSGNITITAGDDININTLQLRNRTETIWGSSKKGGMEIKDKTVNIASNINAEGNVVLTTTGLGTNNEPSLGTSADAALTGSSIQIKGSNIAATSTDSDIAITANNAVTIAAAQNTSYYEARSYSKGRTVSKSSLNLKQSLTNVHSNVAAGDNLTITSGDDIKLIGANIAAASADIAAGKELAIYSVADQNYSYATSSKSRNYSAVVKFVVPAAIPALKLAKNFYGNVPIIGSVASLGYSKLNGDSSIKTNLNERDQLANKASNINVTGDLNLTAHNNLNIVGSKLTADQTALTSTTGDVNIYNTIDHDNTRSQSYKSSTTLASLATQGIQVSTALTLDAMTATKISTPQQQKDKIDANDEAIKKPVRATSQSVNINRDETIVAAEITANNLTINSNKNTNLTSAKIATSLDTTITSGDSTNITTAAENDYSYSFNQSKKPSIAAAMANSVVQIANDAMSNYTHKSSDNTESNSKIEDLVYDQDKQKSATTTSTNIASNINSTGNLNITSQNNTLIKGSNLSGGNIALTTTTGTTTLTSAQDQVITSTESIKQDYNDISTNYNRGRASVDSNSKVEEITITTNTITQKQSTLTAANNITITSNQDLNILSSNLTATAGATTLTSQEGNVNILALQNTTTTSSETKTGTLTLSAGVGNSAIDTVYAEKDLIDAAKALADAKNNLNHIETLKRNGQASSEAVEDARINLTIATLNVTLAELKLAASAAKTASSAKSFGFYGDIRLEIAGSKTTSNSSTATNIASNITSAGNLTITSGLNIATNQNAPNYNQENHNKLIAAEAGNTTITGSNITSTNGDITITAKNTTTINASKDTYNQSSKTKAWSESLTLASTTAGGAQIDQAINALQVSLALNMSKSKSDTSSTTYNNSTLNAENGDVKINSLVASFDVNSTNENENENNAGTDISGANILANNITINTQGNLTVESLQNQYTQKSKSFGLNLGIGGGVGGGSVKASGNGSVGINYATSNTDRLWTDNQTSIIGTNSVTINTKNNTTLTGAVIANILNADDLYASTGKAIGANAIDGGNLTLNTKTITIANLEDHLYTESQGAGIGTSVGFGGGNAKGSGNSSNTANTGAPNTSQGQGTAAANNPNQQNNFYPNGSTTLSLNHGASKKEQTTFATIGQGDIITNTTLTFDADGNLLTNTGGITNDPNDPTNPTIANINRDITKSQVVTRDEITGALNASITIDNRLIAAVYEGLTDQKEKIQNDKTLTDQEKQQKIAALQIEILADEQKNIIKNIATSNQKALETAEVITAPIKEIPAVGTIFYHLSPVEQLAHTFVEKDSKLYFTNTKTGEITEISKADLAKNYGVNGIQTDLNVMVKNYLNNNPELVVRYNPTHGMVGDLLESALGKVATIVHLPEIIAMNRYVVGDMNERRGLTGTLNPITGEVENAPINLFHSQGTIIGVGAMQLYAKTYGNDSVNDINATQRFVAVGPAVLEGDWEKGVRSLDLKFVRGDDYRHDDLDPVRYLTAPSNTINQIVNFFGNPNYNSPIYIPNLTDIPRGIYHLKDIESHDVTNPYYQKPLKSTVQ